MVWIHHESKGESNLELPYLTAPTKHWNCSGLSPGLGSIWGVPLEHWCYWYLELPCRLGPPSLSPVCIDFTTVARTTSGRMHLGGCTWSNWMPVVSVVHGRRGREDAWVSVSFSWLKHFLGSSFFSVQTAALVALACYKENPRFTYVKHSYIRTRDDSQIFLYICECAVCECGCYQAYWWAHWVIIGSPIIPIKAGYPTWALKARFFTGNCMANAAMPAQQ